MYNVIQKKLDAGDVVFLDGGTGTEMQRKGAPMSGEVWCALATRTHPEIVYDVHMDYMRAGADIITANTFASSPLILKSHGLFDQMEELDRLAVDVAIKARDGFSDRPVAIAGSMSAMRPIVPGTDYPDPEYTLAEADARPLYQKKAEILVNAGVDMIIMEMMRDLDYSLWATQAAISTGLPVWLGFSARSDDAGNLTGYNRPELPFSDIIGPLMATGARAALIMHTSVPDTDAAIPVMAEQWDGPLGAYPESGYFTIPDWVFGEITPEDFAAKTQEWVSLGVNIIGGCCGVSPEHIAAAHSAISARH